MSRLTKNLYANAWPKDSLFGLHQHQERRHPVLYGSTWYNIGGELLGYGDLAADDFVQIAAEIAADEIFVISPVTPSGQDQDIDHIVRYAWFVIMVGAIFALPVRSVRQNGDTLDHYQLGEITVITREHLLDLATTPAPTS